VPEKCTHTANPSALSPLRDYPSIPEGTPPDTNYIGMLRHTNIEIHQRRLEPRPICHLSARPQSLSSTRSRSDISCLSEENKRQRGRAFEDYSHRILASSYGVWLLTTSLLSPSMGCQGSQIKTKGKVKPSRPSPERVRLARMIHAYYERYSIHKQDSGPRIIPMNAGRILCHRKIPL